MRGFAGFFFDALLPGIFAILFSSGLFVGMWKGWRQPSKSGAPRSAQHRSVLKGIMSLGAFLMFIAVLLGVIFSAFRLHYELWVLNPQDVQEMRIGHNEFSDRPSIERVINDLKSSEWYSVNHGGWGDETPMVITMRSGAQWQMQVGYHFTQHGAVILRSTGPQGSGWNLGQVFSLTLPRTLEQLGVPLSHCDTSYGHPCAAPLISPAAKSSH